MKIKNNVLYSILEQRRILIEKGFNLYSLHEAQVDDGVEPSERKKALYKGRGGELKNANAEEYIKIVGELILDLTPIAGDIKGVYDAIEALRNGENINAAIGLIAVVPGVGLPADVSRAFNKASKRLSSLTTIPKTPPSIPTPKLPDYTKPPSFPGSKPIEIPPQFDPNRPFWKPGQPKPQQPDVPVTPKPPEPDVPVTPKPSEPKVPETPKPYSPPPLPKQPDVPSPPKQPETPDVEPKEPETPDIEPKEPETPEVEPKEPKEKPKTKPPKLPNTDTEEDKETDTEEDTETDTETDTKTTTDYGRELQTSPQQQFVNPLLTQVGTTLLPQPKRSPPKIEKKISTTTEYNPPEKPKKFYIPSGKIDQETKNINYASVQGDLSSQDVNAYIVKILGKYSGTTRLK